MTLKSRLEKLEEAAPRDSDGIKMIWNTIVRRDGSGLLIERPFSATIVRKPDAPNETFTRLESEGQAAFLNRVLVEVRRVRGREDPIFEEGVRWTSNRRADISE